MDSTEKIASHDKYYQDRDNCPNLIMTIIGGTVDFIKNKITIVWICPVCEETGASTRKIYERED